MPLNRDQTLEPNLNARNFAPSAPPERQRTHSIAGSDLSFRSRPSTPQAGMNNQSARRDYVNPPKNPEGGRKFQLDEEMQPAANVYKMPVADTMQGHKSGKSQHSTSGRFQNNIPKQESLRASTGTAKSRVSL